MAVCFDDTLKWRTRLSAGHVRTSFHMSHDGTPYRLKLLLVYWCEARADYRVTIVVQLSVRHARLFQLNAGSQANFDFL